ncbi:phenylacetate--CoA ligase family protein, partial [Nocardioides sp.]|uniref:phenylacetate--CoA ligase family protein n=1 Tax=Nocardioides sp. TaxID=35761 RepID=UPI0027342F62
ARLAAAGVDPTALDVAALDRVPVLGKDALPALQRQHPPYGGLVADDAPVERVFASPGPIYEAQLAGEDPWRWAPALRACGIGAGDVVLNCFGYHLSPAGMMFDLGCRAVGATVVPGGVGAMEIQAQVIADLGVTAYVGLPSYLAGLIEKYDAAALAADRWRLAKALVTAEPLPESLRGRLRERVPTVLMAYGTAEAGLIGHEVAAGTGLEVPDDVFVEICQPETGIPVDGEDPGEVVVTMVGAGSPLLRFGTGDVSRWQLVEGRLRLAGVLGRVGAAVKVRGLFIHPHQAAEVVGSLAEEGVRAARFVVQRPADRDVLRLEVVVSGDVDPEGVAAVAVRLSRELLRVRPDVAVVEALPDGAVLVDERVWG